ncbi:hypothetical protein PsYK624_122490 [Phanerochaete sordida]|uniref:F-box domain-containing protein n=1 Tax=Phanerochaete sordida TaxID=48140 RepID=A0A9P3LI03_9APHY|nr:hypothetical protein PsYK624_122490 [Phanerochaete sordida]
MLDTLPPETLTGILQAFPDVARHRSLEAMSLVSKRCSPVAQRELFARVFVIIRPSMDIENTIRKAWEPMGVLRYGVRRLTVKASIEMMERLYTLRPLPFPEIYPSDIYGLLSFFSATRHLDIVSLRWQLPDPLSPSPTFLNTHVTKIRISYVDFSRVADLDAPSHILSALPQARSVEFTQCRSGATWPNSKVEVSSVTRLHLSFVRRTMFTSLGVLPKFTHLQSLVVDGAGDFDLPLIGQQIASSAGTLQDITFRIVQWRSNNTTFDNDGASFEKCSRLQTFTIFFPNFSFFGLIAASDINLRLITLMKTLPACLRTLRVIVDGERRPQAAVESSMRLADWRACFAALNTPNLEKVTVILEGKPMGVKSYRWTAYMERAINRALRNDVNLVLVVDNHNSIFESRVVDRMERVRWPTTSILLPK